MKKHKVTVITTIKNEKDNLQDFIRSIFAQSRQPDEVVVVDGGSNDGTIDVLKWLGEFYKGKLRYFVEPGLNISAGRNFAISKAKYEIIAGVDGGTTLQKDWLELLVKPLEEDESIDVVSGFFIPEAKTDFEKYLAAVTVPIEEELRDEKFLPSSRSIAFRKKCWESVGGYPQWLPICEDLIFDIKMKNKGYRFVVEPKALSSWRPRPNTKAFFMQYYRYAKGDGHGKLWYRRHLIRYTTYLTAIIILLLAFKENILWLAPALVGGILYTLTYYNRFFRHFPNEKFRVVFISYFAIPALMFVGDTAKMIGFPVGLFERWSGKIKFEEYRS